MQPTKENYPEFVPDQLLTSEHLNQMFGYLEEQGRLTRTNLIGIGIVCGLEVRTNATATEITITAGCGVTSEGYLVSVPTTTYTSRKPFNAVQERIYDRFVDGSKNPLFPIDELKQAATEEDSILLTAESLANKAVLIFVEILSEGAKNCNPNSCDDKGVQVTVTFRPLLIDKEHAGALSEGDSVYQSVLELPSLSMRRYNVPASAFTDTAAVFTAYQQVLSAAFLSRVKQVFSQAYSTFIPLLLDLYPADPFSELDGNFDFLHDGSMEEEQLINIQYYYDLFSDLLLAYEELRKTGSALIASCCPDSNLFPRHLSLDLAVRDGATTLSDYRHYFIPSPVMQNNTQLVSELRSLFRRLTLLIDTFYTPAFTVGAKAAFRQSGVDKNIRITPSKFGDLPLSAKSIPFYYKLSSGPDTLLQHWSFKKSLLGQSHKNLSYHAETYNSTDEEVSRPLLYDLEPYNFLRIEGHLGKPFTAAIQNIIRQKLEFRLPFEVIALGTDIAALRSELRELTGANAEAGLRSRTTGQKLPQCHFQDLESLFDALAAELICSLCREMKYFYGLPGNNRTANPPSTIPQVSLLKKCDPNFRITAGTLGHEFEVYYNKIKNNAYIRADVFTGSIPRAADGSNQNGTVALALLYYIEKLSETLVADLPEFNLEAFNIRYDDLMTIAAQIRESLSQDKAQSRVLALREDLLDHLDALLYACRKAQFNALYKDYVSRWMNVMMLQKFGYFLQMHPGIQHKAGVPVGGTFILVYHDARNDAANPANDAVLVNSDVVSRLRINKADHAKDDRILSYESEKLIGKPLFQELANTNNESDEVLAGLIDEIGTGTVIADFYLPYLCYSDCPPIQFIINQIKQPEDPDEELDIALEREEYCSNDRAQYTIVVSPAGGEVSGEGVKDGAKAKPKFLPVQTDLQGGKQKVVTLTYSKDGQSVTREVVVYQTPAAKFKVTSSAAAAGLFSFENESVFADRFEWDLGDGVKSADENPSHRYNNGSYTVSLVVTNGICSSAPFTQQIDVRASDEPVRVCMPLADIIKEYKNVGSGDPQLFEKFKRTFESFERLDGFFAELERIQSQPQAEQLEFLKSKEDPDVATLLFQWLEEIRPLISSDFAGIALEIQRVLIMLALYIQCIQTEDLGRTDIDLSGVFKYIGAHVGELMRLARENPNQYQPAIENLKDIFKQELEKIEPEDRPVYLDTIKSFVDTLGN